MPDPRRARRTCAAVVAGVVGLMVTPAGGQPRPAAPAKAQPPAYRATRIASLGAVDVMFDPATGRTFTLPGGGGTQPEPQRDGMPEGEPAPAYGEVKTVAGWDSRLAGQRRSVFYPDEADWQGPGRIDTILGGSCDGRGPLDVAVDPSSVRVDAAGRVFWLDHNWNAHHKAAAYVRVLENGRVRTLGTITGPVEGRAFRDTGSSTGLSRIEPDGAGGVYYTFLGHFTGISPTDMSPAKSYDDAPVATVVGHIDAAGRGRFVSGVPGWRWTWFSSASYGSGYPGAAGYSWAGGESPNPEDNDPLDGGPVAGARFRSITALTSWSGGLLVADGDRAPGWSSASSARASRTQQEEQPGGTHADTAALTLRFLNRSPRDAVLYDGTPQRMVVKAGTVATIAGRRVEADKYPAPSYGQHLVPLDSRLSYVSGMAAGGDGVVRMLMASPDTVQLVVLNTTGQARRVHGVLVPPGRLTAVAGGPRGYAGDGATGKDARFDVRNLNGWYTGDLAVAPDGTALVADTLNHRVRRVDPAGRVSTVAAAPLTSPMGVAVARDGLLVSDWGNAVIRSLGADGTLRTAIGTGSPAYCGDGGAAGGTTTLGGAGAGQPHDAVADSRGNTYVADLALGTVRRIAPDGTVRTVVGQPLRCPSGEPAHTSLPTCPAPLAAGDGGPAGRATLRAPGYLLVDRYDNLYVSDGANVRYVNFRSYPLTVQGVTVAPGTIATVLRSNEILERIVIAGPPGTDVERTYYTVVGLGGLALDDIGTLYAADIAGNRILGLNWCGLLETIAGTGKAVLPTVDDHNGDGGPALLASIAPTSLAWDRSTNVLYVTSASEGRVRAINLGRSAVTAYGVTIAAGNVDTVAGGAPCNVFGQEVTRARASYCVYGDGGPGREAALQAPFGIAVRPGGRLFVSDALSGTVRVLEPSGTIGTIAGSTPDHDGNTPANVAWWIGGICGDGGRGWDACFSGPTSAQLTPSGDLLVADSLSGRVRRIRDALRAVVRPPYRSVPLRGAGWRFTPGQVLRTGDDTTHVANATVGVDSRGHAYVTAAEITHGDSAVGCPAWRVDVDADGHGRDDVRFLGRPDATAVDSVTLNTPGYQCSLAVGAPPPLRPGSPLGDEDRLSHVAVRRAGVTLTRAGLLTQASTSTNAGETFLGSTAGLVSPTGLALTRQAYVTAAGADATVMSYNGSGIIATGGFGVGFARSVNGAAYGYVSEIPYRATPDYREGNPYSDLVTGAPITVGLATVYVPLHHMVERYTVDGKRLGTADVFTLARSVDGGATWERSAPAFTIPCARGDASGTGSWWVPDAWCGGNHGKPQAVADAAGNLYVVWDEQGRVLLTSSGDGGRTWAKPVRVDAGLSLATFPVAVAGADGRVAVVFLGTTSRAPSLATRDAEWSVYVATTPAARGAAPRWQQSLVSERPVHVGQICQRNTLCAGDSFLSSSIGDAMAATMNPQDGRLVVAHPLDPGLRLRGPARQAASVVVTRQCDGFSLLGDRPASRCAAPAAAPPPRVEVACPPQGLDPAGDAAWRGAQRPNLDLTSLGVWRDGDDLVVRLGVQAPSAEVPLPGTGMRWTAFWYADRQGYWAQALTPTTDGVAYRWGVVSPGGGLTYGGVARGVATTTGYELRVPRTRVGAGSPETTLYHLSGRSEVLTGSAPDLPGGTWERVDVVTATRGYDGMLRCTAPAGSSPQGLALRPAPAPTLLPCDARPPAPRPEPPPPGAPPPPQPQQPAPPAPEPGIAVPPALPPVPPAQPPVQAPNLNPNPGQQIQHQPGQQAQTQGAQQAQPMVGAAVEPEEQHETVEEYAASRLAVPPVLPAAMALATAVGVAMAHERRRQFGYASRR